MDDTQQQAAAPPSTPAPAVHVPPAPPVLVLGEYRHIHRQENDQVDSLEFGPASCRQKIYYNAGKVEDAKAKVNNAIAVMEYAMQQVREKGFDVKKGAP